MDCVRIHTNIVHTYVRLFVRTNWRIRFCNFVWQIHRQSSALTLFYSLSLWSLAGERDADAAINSVIDCCSWRESRLRNSHRTSQLAFILVSILVLFHKYFFSFSFFILFIAHESAALLLLWLLLPLLCRCPCYLLLLRSLTWATRS